MAGGTITKCKMHQERSGIDGAAACWFYLWILPLNKAAGYIYISATQLDPQLNTRKIQDCTREACCLIFDSIEERARTHTWSSRASSGLRLRIQKIQGVRVGWISYQAPVPPPRLQGRGHTDLLFFLFFFSFMWPKAFPFHSSAIIPFIHAYMIWYDDCVYLCIYLPTIYLLYIFLCISSRSPAGSARCVYYVLLLEHLFFFFETNRQESCCYIKKRNAWTGKAELFTLENYINSA